MKTKDWISIKDAQPTLLINNSYNSFLILCYYNTYNEYKLVWSFNFKDESEVSHWQVVKSPNKTNIKNKSK